MRLPILLLAAVVAVGCGSCLVRAVQLVRAAPDLFPADVDTDGTGYGGPEAGPSRPCAPTDPAFVAEFSGDPLITTVPPGAMLRLPRTLENCAGDGGGVASLVEGAPPGSTGPVTGHYRALLVAGGWVVAETPAAGALLSATRAWRDSTVFFSLWVHADVFRAEITLGPP
jgi:hypothetical protein